MKTFAMMVIATLSMLTAGAASAQNANMMNGGMWDAGWMGGYSGMWVPFLLAIVVVGLVAWIVRRGDK